MDELHEQTVNLLSFQQLPKTVFDAQVAFNLLDRYGEKSLPSLDSVESRIQQHFHRLVGDRLAVPSLMLLQAPIFHGHAFSLYLELEQAAQTEELTAAISGEHVDVLQGAGGIAQQRECRRPGANPGVCASRFATAKRVLAMGRIRQPADRGA